MTQGAHAAAGTTGTAIFCDRDGKNALHWAAQKGHVPVVRWLVESGDYDPLHTDKFGRSCLHWAVYGEAFRVVDWLLCNTKEAEASLQLETHSGKNPIELAKDLGKTDLHAFLTSGMWRTVKRTKTRPPNTLPAATAMATTTGSGGGGLPLPATVGAATPSTATVGASAAAAASSTVAGTGGGGAQLSHDGVTGVSDARQDDATEDEVSKWLQTLDAKLAQYAPRFHEVRYPPAFFCRR